MKRRRSLGAPLSGCLRHPGHIVGIMSRSAHALDAYPGISYRLAVRKNEIEQDTKPNGRGEAPMAK